MWWFLAGMAFGGFCGIRFAFAYIDKQVRADKREISKAAKEVELARLRAKREVYEREIEASLTERMQ